MTKSGSHTEQDVRNLGTATATATVTVSARATTSYSNNDKSLTLLLQEDITNGLERRPIPVLVSLSAFTSTQQRQSGFELYETLLGRFNQYITDSQLPDGTALTEAAFNKATIVSDEDGGESEPEKWQWEWRCDCESTSIQDTLCTVLDGDECSCVSEFGNFYSSSKTDDTQQVLNINALPPQLPLVECSNACACAEQCGNRVSQRGVSAPLSIQLVESGLGLGLFHSPPEQGNVLPRGSFISLYAGEYLADEEAKERWKVSSECPGQGNYILSLRFSDQMIHIDPRYKGNVGRFLNHSCEPTCVIQLVRWGATSRWPRAAIFTKRDLSPGEELTFDYADASGESPHQEVLAVGNPSQRTRCLCGSKNCRGWMPFDETL